MHIHAVIGLRFKSSNTSVALSRLIPRESKTAERHLGIAKGVCEWHTDTQLTLWRSHRLGSGLLLGIAAYVRDWKPMERAWYRIALSRGFWIACVFANTPSEWRAHTTDGL